MKTFKINWKYIIGLIIVIGVIYYWFTNCSGKGDGSVVIDTKEVKGSFPTVPAKDIEVKEIPTANDSKSNSQNLFDSSGSAKNARTEDFKKMYNLTQKQYDSLLVVNRTLDSLANSLYDKRLQPILDACKFIEFKHELDNDTIHITLTGLSRGAPQNLNTSYTIKSRKQEVKVPVTVFRLLGGIETGMTKTLSGFNVKASLGFQNKKGGIISISADTDQRFYIGYQYSIFTIKK